MQNAKALSGGLSELLLNPRSTPTLSPVVPGQVGRCCLWELGSRSKYKNSSILLVNVKGPETLWDTPSSNNPSCFSGTAVKNSNFLPFCCFGSWEKRQFSASLFSPPPLRFPHVKFLPASGLPAFLSLGFLFVLEMGWSLICNPGWPQNPGAPVASDSSVLGLKGEGAALG